MTAVIASQLPENLILHLRTDKGVIKANVSASSSSSIALEDLKGVTLESLVHVIGHVAPRSTALSRNGNHLDGESLEDKANFTGAYEVSVSNITIVARASKDLPPFSRNENDLVGRLDNRLLDLRSAGNGAIFKLHSGMCQLIVEFLCSNEFHWIHQPRIISHRVAGDKEYFDLPYFGGNAWLAQNSQYQNQMVLSTDMQRVFDMGPAFRAEVKSRTSGRHLTEVSHTGIPWSACFASLSQISS